MSLISYRNLNFRYVKKQKQNPDTSIRYTPNYEINKVFTSEQENTLAKYIIKCSQMFYGLPIIDCRKLAYELAIANNLKIPETWETNKMAGIEWMRSFLRRNPTLSLRTPEGCSLARATSFNQHNVNKFFDNLYNVMRRNERFSDGTRIYNLDETSTVTVQKSAKVISAKGVKQVNKVTSGEKGVLVTTCVIVNATGNHLPPAMVFPRVHFKEHMIAGAPPGTLGLASPTGWMNSELFLRVMTHFIKHTNSSKDNPSLLLYDNHESHLSISVLNLAKENGVTILTFPPHSTNKLQPLDVGVFKPFSLAYNAAVDSWLMRHPGKPISIYEVASCVGEAYLKSMLPGNITAAFRKCGIYPYDRHIFTEVDFLPSSVTDRPAPDQIVDEPEEEPTHSHSQTPPQVASPNMEQFVSPEDIRGYPKAEARKNSQQGRKKGKSIIATDTPEKNEIEERFNKKRTALEKQDKKKTTKRKIVDEEDEETENEEWKSDGTSSNFEPEIDPSNFEELERAPVEGDYVLIEFAPENSKSKKVYYVGKLLSGLKENAEFEVTFLRRSRKLSGKFILPDVPDNSMVLEKDIKMILPQPLKCGQTKRQSSHYQFEISFDLIDIR